MKLEKDIFKSELEKRAKSVLLNTDEITPKCIEVATDETLEMCKDKDIKAWAAMDFAMLRVKLYLKIGLEENDEIVLKEALKSIVNSPSLDESKSTFFGYEAI